MSQIDEMFGQFIRELEIRGRAEIIIVSYKSSFRCFRKLMPQIDISQFNESSIFIFANKLRKVRIWNNDLKDYKKINSDLVLNFINYLWSFLLWLRRKNQSSPSVSNANEVDLLKKIILEYHEQCEYIFNFSTTFGNEGFGISNDLLCKQLNRKFSSFFNSDDAIFYKYLSDYVQFIVSNTSIGEIIQNEILGKMENNKSDCYFNCLLNSWLNLELAFLLKYRYVELKQCFSEDKEVMSYMILKNTELFNNVDCVNNYILNLVRNKYSLCLIRIHNFIMEKLESKQFFIESHSSEKFVYKFMNYGIPTGELIITGFKPIIFLKNPAKIVQFYYLLRKNQEYHTYKDFNEFLNNPKKNLTSNKFRLIINAINKRVKEKTGGIIKQIIIKRSRAGDVNEKNYYHFIESI